jgi:hypothetical protein
MQIKGDVQEERSNQRERPPVSKRRTEGLRRFLDGHRSSDIDGQTVDTLPDGALARWSRTGEKRGRARGQRLNSPSL